MAAPHTLRWFRVCRPNGARVFDCVAGRLKSVFQTASDVYG
ncbi:hypothetical protein [Kingella potus]|nr:hypothetical protein [Kingella potus]